jgi:hypothetical protein
MQVAAQLLNRQVPSTKFRVFLYESFEIWLCALSTPLCLPVKGRSTEAGKAFPLDGEEPALSAAEGLDRVNGSRCTNVGVIS